MAAVPPPEVSYRALLPNAVVETGALSNLQLEAVLYAGQQFETILPDGKRSGFFLGDGTGVGKGRTISGIVYDHYCAHAAEHGEGLWQPVPIDPAKVEADGPTLKRAKMEHGSSNLSAKPPHCTKLSGKRKFRALWVSTAWDLHADAIRDLNAICCAGETKTKKQANDKLDQSRLPFKIHALREVSNENPAARTAAKLEGLFRDSGGHGILFCTYSLLVTRSTQVMNWLSGPSPLDGGAFRGCLVFDEAHKAKNLYSSKHSTAKATKTGRVVADLQAQLPLGRVVYASATGAGKLQQMGYMDRLGLWGPGTPFPAFNGSGGFMDLESGGLSAAELVAMELKVRY
jgi:hypothetical protein